MPTYLKASHYRSILKGITWRVIALIDTILLVLLITCFFDNCSIESAVKIGFAELLVKLIIYYIHERIWENRYKGKLITSLDTLFKTISWRLIASLTTFMVAGTILENFDKIVMSITILELGTKFILYYLHERAWLKIPLGEIRHFFSGGNKLN